MRMILGVVLIFFFSMCSHGADYTADGLEDFLATECMTSLENPETFTGYLSDIEDIEIVHRLIYKNFCVPGQRTSVAESSSLAFAVALGSERALLFATAVTLSGPRPSYITDEYFDLLANRLKRVSPRYQPMALYYRYLMAARGETSQSRPPELLRKSAEGGNAAALLLLADNYIKVDPKLKKGEYFRVVSCLADEGYPGALWHRARAYKIGEDVARSLEFAEKDARAAAVLGITAAPLELLLIGRLQGRQHPTNDVVAWLYIDKEYGLSLESEEVSRWEKSASVTEVAWMNSEVAKLRKAVIDNSRTTLGELSSRIIEGPKTECRP